LNASEASPGRTPQGQTRVSGNRQIVVPKAAFDSASLSRGDRLKAYAIGPGDPLQARWPRANRRRAALGRPVALVSLGATACRGRAARRSRRPPCPWRSRPCP
jgi:bifunctional DNA-binding transcriptional regulator/antitoxin component of YhaV-PrlF toxin-antitoxin module